MKKVTLIKGNVRKEFTERAAQIARDALGWNDLPSRPDEIFKKTLPPEIKPPKNLIEPPKLPDLPVTEVPEVKQIIIEPEKTPEPVSEPVKDPVKTKRSRKR